MTRQARIFLQVSIASIAALAFLMGVNPSYTSRAAASAPSQAVTDLVDRALNGPAGPEDEGNYNLIDPIGPGANTEISAADEVYSSTLIVAKYTPWKSYSDPFAAAPGSTPPPGPYGPPRVREHAKKAGS